MIQEAFTSLRASQLLKEVGMPQGSTVMYYNDRGEQMICSPWDKPTGAAIYTQQAAMKWLREEKHININIVLWSSIEEAGKSTWVIDFVEMPKGKYIRRALNIYWGIYDDRPASYEQAVDRSIQAACHYLIEKAKAESPIEDVEAEYIDE